MVCCSGVPSQTMMLDNEPSKDRPAKPSRARTPVPRHNPGRHRGEAVLLAPDAEPSERSAGTFA
jgi:hypothetical protein